MTIHIDSMEQTAPEPSDKETCKCEKPDKRNWEVGYGMGGGGIGVYTFCIVCGEIVSKTQDKDYS